MKSILQYMDSGIIMLMDDGGKHTMVIESFRQYVIVVSIMFRCSQLLPWFCACVEDDDKTIRTIPDHPSNALIARLRSSFVVFENGISLKPVLFKRFAMRCPSTTVVPHDPGPKSLKMD